MNAVNDYIVGANAGRSRGHNRQVVLGRIRAAEQIGRAEIARASGLSTQAVSNIIADLIGDGLIREQGTRRPTRGLPVTQYALNPLGGYAIGIEIRPDAIFGVVLDFCGNPVAQQRREVRVNSRADVISAARDMNGALQQAIAADPDRVLGIGVVMPGPFGSTGANSRASELPILGEDAPQDWLSEALGAPVLIENDANAAAISERVSGAAQGLESYAFVYFGTGLGLGIVHKGRLMAGALGNAGEIGHIPVCDNGNMVVLEDVVSRLSLTAALRAGGITVNNVDDLAALYEAGNPIVMGWLERVVAPLSTAVGIVENLFDPQTVILGGAMPDNILDHILASLHLPARSVANRPDRDIPRLLRGKSGRMTATFGAAALVVNRAFVPEIVSQPRAR